MGGVPHMVLVAKLAVVEDQIERFLTLCRQQQWDAAARRQVDTLGSLADLLMEWADVLQQTALRKKQEAPPEGGGDGMAVQAFSVPPERG